MNDVTTKQLLEAYYQGLSGNGGWETVLSDDFKFIGGNMLQATPVTGKPAYIEVLNRFSRVFENVRVKEMIIEGDNAAVIANYDLVFSNGTAVNGNVAEFWKVKKASWIA